MGISCEINFFKPSDGAYQPGQAITGIIKYAVDEPMEFDKITTSLKGRGFVILKVSHSSKNNRTYRGSEEYVDIDNVVQEEKLEVPIGEYEIKFDFKIPYNIPSTVNFYKYVGRYNVKCKIMYYIRIKFERSGIFTRNKHFRKEITVISAGKPILLREPVIYGETKKLMRLFSSKNSFVDIKATIFNSVIPIGGRIEVHYEVNNNSSVLVKSVKTRLTEIYKFYAPGHIEVKSEKEVPNTDTKTSAIQCGDAQAMPVEINIPSDIHSLENAKIVSRLYSVQIEVALPLPHRNVVLNIPVQIGAIDESAEENRVGASYQEMPYEDSPPSYWEAMGEMKKENDDDRADEDNDNTCNK